MLKCSTKCIIRRGSESRNNDSRERVEKQREKDITDSYAQLKGKGFLIRQDWLLYTAL